LYRNLYDDGGPSANYANNKAYTLVIQPSGATSISMNFSQWAAENNYDFMKFTMELLYLRHYWAAGAVQALALLLLTAEL